MIQFDEHIFQMGWNHQPDKFARPEVLQLNGSVNHFKLSPFRPPKEVTIAELPRIRERPKNKTTHHRVHQKICFYSNWNFGKSSPPNPPFFFGKHPKQIYFRERNSGLNRVTCFWQQKWLSREYHSRSELDSRWSELSWRAAFAGMFWTWPRRGWCVLACLGFNHKSFGRRNVHHDTFTWVFVRGR